MLVVARSFGPQQLPDCHAMKRQLKPAVPQGHNKPPSRARHADHPPSEGGPARAPRGAPPQGMPSSSSMRPIELWQEGCCGHVVTRWVLKMPVLTKRSHRTASSVTQEDVFCDVLLRDQQFGLWVAPVSAASLTCLTVRCLLHAPARCLTDGLTWRIGSVLQRCCGGGR